MTAVTLHDFRIAPGDTLGVAAPAGPFDSDQFQRGVDVLTGMGFSVQPDPRITAATGFLAGGDRQRADVLHDLFDDDGVAAIICARGGYGSMRLLALLDADLIRRHPKPLIGFSDISALLNFLVTRCAVPAIHGPVVTSLAAADSASVEALRRLLTGAPEGGALAAGTAWGLGRATGVLLGGNLTTVNHLLATPYMPDFSGAVLLLEDVNEAPYRIDRMLTQMRMAGCFDALAGVALGDFDQCGPEEALWDVLSAHFSSLGIPVLCGLPVGHGPMNAAVPFGVPVTLDADTGRLSWAFDAAAPSADTEKTT